MSEWAARRFWEKASVAPSGARFSVRLDDRPVRTPAKAPLVVPTRELASSIAAEWDAQSGKIDPRDMPLTRAANAAIDKVVPQQAEVVSMLADYGDADLTCYRAEAPAELVARQAAAWDPLLDWATDCFGARLVPVTGVVHSPQNATSLARLKQPLMAMSAFELAGFHDLVSLSGSLVIGLAASRNFLPIDVLWARSRIDEDWQEQKWGRDDEASAAAAQKRRGFLEAAKFYRLSTINS